MYLEVNDMIKITVLHNPRRWILNYPFFYRMEKNEHSGLNGLPKIA